MGPVGEGTLGLATGGGRVASGFGSTAPGTRAGTEGRRDSWELAMAEIEGCVRGIVLANNEAPAPAAEGIATTAGEEEPTAAAAEVETEEE